MKKRKKRIAKCKACRGIGKCSTCKGTGEIRIINARSKGSTFERKIAQEVSVWTGIEFKRTPMSGGWAKTGDITPKEPKEMVKFPFNLELKNQESWSWGLLFQKGVDRKRKKKLIKGKLMGPVKDWWLQAKGDAKKSKRIPILIFTRNGEHEYCMIRNSLFQQLNLEEQLKTYIVRGPFRIFLWKELLKIPYQDILIGIKRNLIEGK